MKIPVKISPFFWVTAGLIGYLNSMGDPQPLLFTLIWIVVIFVSILVHELGHALTASYFGQKPRIELVAFGGLTYPEGARLKGWREFLVVLNGPLSGFLLFLIASTLIGSGAITSSYLLYSLYIFQWVNLFWTIVNLLPVMPLDGGQLLRIVFESIFGAKGVKYALLASIILSALCTITFFLIGFFLVGAIFFLFAFQNFVMWKKTRMIAACDRDEDLTEQVEEIEKLLMQGKKEEADSLLVSMRMKAKKGVIFHLTSEYLAELRAERREYLEVYEILKPLKKELTPKSKLYLHRAAFEMGDYSLVIELAGPCFQFFPDSEMAVRNAEACAALSQIDPAVGWLKAARHAGIENLEPILSKEIFNSIRKSPSFHKLYD